MTEDDGSARQEGSQSQSSVSGVRPGGLACGGAAEVFSMSSSHRKPRIPFKLRPLVAMLHLAATPNGFLANTCSMPYITSRIHQKGDRVPVGGWMDGCGIIHAHP